MKWSDGQPLTGDDVAFTFQLLKKFPGWTPAPPRTATITANGQTVTVTFTTSMFVKKDKVAGPDPDRAQAHLVDHRRRRTRTPTRTRSAPGPYTIKSFTPQTTVLDLRPSGYWQDPPKVKELRYTSYTDNDAETTALSSGETEWSFVFIPNYKEVFEAKDPAHYKVWAPPVLAHPWPLHQHHEEAVRQRRPAPGHEHGRQP